MQDKGLSGFSGGIGGEGRPLSSPNQRRGVDLSSSLSLLGGGEDGFDGPAAGGGPGGSGSGAKLHECDKLKKLEEGRTSRFAEMKKLRMEAKGRRDKLSCLPRLIGGRSKPGEDGSKCCDTGRPILPGDTTHPCAFQGCVSVFSDAAYARLLSYPEKMRLCEDCFSRIKSMPIKLTAERLRVALKKQLPDPFTREKFFDRIDTNHDKVVTTDELREYLQKLKLQPPLLTSEQIQDIVAMFDTNGDNNISYEEFMEWISLSDNWEPPNTSQLRNLRDVSKQMVTALIGETLDAILEVVWDVTTPRVDGFWTVRSNPYICLRSLEFFFFICMFSLSIFIYISICLSIYIRISNCTSISIRFCISISNSNSISTPPFLAAHWESTGPTCQHRGVRMSGQVRPLVSRGRGERHDSLGFGRRDGDLHPARAGGACRGEADVADHALLLLRCGQRRLHYLRGV
jgi:hypothetical protein